MQYIELAIESKRANKSKRESLLELAIESNIESNREILISISVSVYTATSYTLVKCSICIILSLERKRGQL